MQQIAIYDMDRTITRRGTYTPFLIFAALRHKPWRMLGLALFIMSMIGYILGWQNRKSLKSLGFKFLIGREIAADRLDEISAAFAKRTVKSGLLPGTLVLIEADRKAGKRLVMATASPEYYVAPIAKLLKFDAIITTKQARGSDGRYLATIEGENCYGPEKLTRIQAWLASEQLLREECEVSFYSDHRSDIDVLRWADRATLVNPDRKTRRMNREYWQLAEVA
jgi:HAD superfamily hydrolase (TIGR01490 family)